MASNPATAPAASLLTFMAKLSPCVYVYRPEASSPAPSYTTETTSPQRPNPKLILLATWMGARDPHIAKYVAQYQALFPCAPILLLRSEPRHFLLPRGTPRELAPAVSFVRSIFPEPGNPVPSSPSSDKDQRPQLLVHAWSNGGTASLYNLRRALSLQLTPTGSPPPLPAYTLVLDSTPGTFHYGASFRAFTIGLSGIALWLMAPLMHAVCAWYWFRHVLIGRARTGPLATVAAALNDRQSDGVVQRSEVRRTYVYSREDRLVDWRDVEAHAADAEQRGFRVRTERFEGSEHVAHARVDPARYWRVVRETWEGVA